MEVFQAVFEIAKCIWEPASRHIGYSINLKENFAKLKVNVNELYNRRDDVLDQLERIKLLKIPSREGKDWLAKVEEIGKQVEMLEKEFATTVSKRSKGWCPGSSGRMALGERVEELIEGVKDLYEKSKLFESIYISDLPPEIVEKVPVLALKPESSTYHTVQQVLNCIKDDRIQMVGIWGMGGVGKTTILKTLNNMPEIEKMFQMVVWVTVSKDWSIRKVQKEIAQRLPLALSNDESDDSVARKLLKNLKDKKYLLLLDDVWEMVDLHCVGMPDANQNNGCKVVLTTRQLGVCRRMKTGTEIKVNGLSDGEAWELFCSNVGEIAVSPSIFPIAKSIVRKCDGLPLAINVVGGVLRKVEDIHVWCNVLNVSNSVFPASHVDNDLNELLFKRLKFSYDQLKDERTKKCFLYCGLYPEDYKIEKARLIDYWIAEGFISCRGCTIEETRHKGHAILKSFIDASLLEEAGTNSYFDECVKMHDVIRDLVPRISSLNNNGEEGPRFLVKAGECQKEIIINDEEWKCAEWISFMNSSKLSNLPERPKSCMLTTLFLRGTINFRYIPEFFFDNMPNLRVLDLSETAIRHLPTSISKLVHLRALLLEKCGRLGLLPREIGSLKELEVLRITDANFNCIPQEVGELTRLKCLTLHLGTTNIDETIGECLVPHGVLSRLLLLEELCILRSNYTNQYWAVIAGGVTEELCSLNKLSSLTFDFPNVGFLQQFVRNNHPWKNKSLKKTRFFVGNVNWSKYIRFNRINVGRILAYSKEDDQIHGTIPSAVMEVLLHSEHFHLEDHHTIKSVSDLGVHNICHLKYCSLYDCGVESIVRTTENTVLDAAAEPFLSLEHLEISFLGNLTSIWEGPMKVGGGSFTSLITLQVRSCGRLKKLFSWELLLQLHNLEELVISTCFELEELIYSKEEYGISPSFYNYREEAVAALPKLKRLTLWLNRSLNKFASFSRGASSVLWPSLEEVKVYKCLSLKSLPFTVNNAPKLKKIRCNMDWPSRLEWEDDATRLYMDPLFKPSMPNI